MTNNEKKEWLQRYRECWAEVEITQQEIEELNSRAQMLMCHKVTHKKLIDNSPLFRKNFKVEFHGSHTNCVASFA